MPRRIVLLLLIALPLAVSQAPASAATYPPPAGKIWHGITGGRDASHYTSFEQLVGKHQPIWQFFLSWDESRNAGLYIKSRFPLAQSLRTRVMLHITTQSSSGREVITPGQIARGAGDGYLLRLNQLIADSGQITYLRLLAEMNQANNPYAAFGSNGRSRGSAHSTTTFRKAWKRMVLIIRGGAVGTINSKLHALGLPNVASSAGALPTPRVSFLWVPQVSGSPNISANAPSAYYPGDAYVDWVGTDFYSSFPNFSGLERFYRQFTRHKPFAFGEWGVWKSGDDAAFVKRFFSWVRSHGKVRIVMFNQGNEFGGPFRLQPHKRAAAAVRSALRSSVFDPLAPEFGELVG